MGEDAELNERGKEMVHFPMDSRTSRLLLEALDMETRKETASMIAKVMVGTR